MGRSASAKTLAEECDAHLRGMGGQKKLVELVRWERRVHLDLPRVLRLASTAAQQE